MGRKKKQAIGIDDGFLAEVSTLDVSGMKAMIARLEAHKQDAQAYLRENETIVTLSDQLKEMKGPAQDTVKAVNNKQQYLVKLLKEAGEFQVG
jgi:polyribonucleotide nucleotidyltransferase